MADLAGWGMGWKIPPPTKPKKLLKKNAVIFEGSIFSKTFSKIAKNLIFLLNFHQRISKFHRNFPTICVFHPNTRRTNAWFCKSFENYAVKCIFRKLLKKTFENFRELSPTFPSICVFVLMREM